MLPGSPSRASEVRKNGRAFAISGPGDENPQRIEQRETRWRLSQTPKGYSPRSTGEKGITNPPEGESKKRSFGCEAWEGLKFSSGDGGKAAQPGKPQGTGLQVGETIGLGRQRGGGRLKKFESSLKGEKAQGSTTSCKGKSSRDGNRELSGRASQGQRQLL